MEIILLESLNKLGKAGEIVTVRDGFAKNYLLPNKKAVIANKKNKEDLKTKMSQIEQNNQEKQKEAEDLKSQIDGITISVEMEANEDGNLYGTVGQKTIKDEIESKYSINLPSDSIKLSEIKEVGEHIIKIDLYDHVTASLNLEIKKRN